MSILPSLVTVDVFVIKSFKVYRRQCITKTTINVINENVGTRKKNVYWFAFSENKIEAVYLVRYCLLRYVNEAIITN